ncbi:ATP-binding protein [Ancylobacter amanitiformis]|uniref:ATPase/DNA-binding winged helix-turn-helix (WHTH) protein n=1 Tax=Ancylobacter amanitiformis TaxID=217069 RepID=A0ABU0LW97_9HYPH|nr:winged helix-turn-helix domain-containing protein [Ancylobacter amanitiformis]MDQ0512965.1 putative ATPase/DNA-binding winged helix-turn-helix (wHTH) protein [Ancylobacter amanitiformis]
MKPVSRAAQFGSFRLNLSSRQLHREGVHVPMGGRALELLVALIEHAGEVVSKQELLARAWPDLFVEEANLRVQMTALRRVLGDGQDGRHFITNIARRGYSFVADVIFTDIASPDIASTNAGAREATGDPVIHQNLPFNLTTVLGREATVSAIGEELARSRFVSVVGPGGVGKTTVALDVARAALTRDGAEALEAVVLVELAPITDPALVENAVASAIGMTLGTGPLRLGEPLPFERGLLILDNCEHVVAAAATLAELALAANPGLKLLVTSREPLRAQGEHVYRLQGLEVPPREAVGARADLLRYPAARLFVERAAATLGSYMPAPDEIADIVAICRRLDGLPLAIELAAGRVDAFGVKGLAQRLGDVFRLLVAGRRTALPRHQTLQAMLGWSYDHLSPGEQTTLGRLAIFAGHFSLDAAGKVASIEEASWETIENLTSLVAKSLVAADFSQPVPRYRLLEITRAYALERLKEAGGLDRLSRRHAAYMKELIATAEQEWPRAQPTQWLATYAGQLDNVRAALDWSFGPKGDREIGTALIISSATLWFQLSLLNECRARFEHALASLDDGPPLDAPREVALLTTLGTALVYTIGPGPKAEEPLQKACSIARANGGVELQLRAAWALWALTFCSARYAAALEIARDFAALAATVGDVTQAADLIIANRLAGVSLLFLGRVEEARVALEAALGGGTTANAIVRMQYDQEMNGRAFYSANLYLLGLQDQASALASRNTADARARGHATTLALNLVDSGCPVAFYCGEADALAERLDLLADVSGRHPFGPWRAWWRCYRGSLHLLHGAFSPAAEDLAAGIEALEQTGWPIRRAMFLGLHAQALHRLGRGAQARARVEEAIGFSRATGEGWILPELLRIRAGIDAIERPQAALASLDEAWNLAQRTGLRSWALRAATAAARLAPQERRLGQRLSETLAEFSESHAKPDYRAAQHVLDGLGQHPPA